MLTKPCPICKGCGEIDIPFGERLLHLRELNGETQEHVARLLGVTRPSVANIESGKQDISTDKIIILSRHYGVTADYLLGLSNKEAPYD